MATIKILELQVLTCSAVAASKNSPHIFVDGKMVTIYLFFFFWSKDLNKLQLWWLVARRLDQCGFVRGASCERWQRAPTKSKTISVAKMSLLHWIIIQHKQNRQCPLSKNVVAIIFRTLLNVNRNARRPRFLLGIFCFIFPDIFSHNFFFSLLFSLRAFLPIFHTDPNEIHLWVVVFFFLFVYQSRSCRWLCQSLARLTIHLFMWIFIFEHMPHKSLTLQSEYQKRCILVTQMPNHKTYKMKY